MFVFGKTEYDKNILSDSTLFRVLWRRRMVCYGKKQLEHSGMGFKKVDYDRSDVSDIKTFVLHAGVLVDISKRTVLNLYLDRNQK